MFSCVEPVLSNEDEVSYSRTQHRAPGEIQARELAIKSLALYQLSASIKVGLVGKLGWGGVEGAD